MNAGFLLTWVERRDRWERSPVSRWIEQNRSCGSAGLMVTGMGVGAWVIGASYRTVDGQGARRAHFNAKELGGHGMDTAVV